MGHQELLMRLGTAALLGSLIGLERQRLDKSAGLRTHMLVSVGSALVMIVSAYGFGAVLRPGRVVLDPSRVAAQVVSGIGFLGAGAILRKNETVHGLTTAASIWTVAGVGLAAGGGLYLAAASATGLILLILAAIKPLEDRLLGHDRRRILTIIASDRITMAELETCAGRTESTCSGFVSGASRSPIFVRLRSHVRMLMNRIWHDSSTRSRASRACIRSVSATTDAPSEGGIPEPFAVVPPVL